jgi:asparagine synthase (glutamine-hydrolysing)
MRWLSPGTPRRLAAALLPARYPMPSADVTGYLHFIAATTPDERTALWRHHLRPHAPAIPAACASAITDGAPLHALSLAQQLDLALYLPGDLLAKVDITSMMHGLEVRTPFADVRMAELSARIPPEHQMALVNGKWQGKHVLRMALAPILPDAILQRAKRGFAVPLARWFAHGGPLHAAVQTRLLDPQGPLTSLFSPAGITGLVRRQRLGPMWLLLVLDEWLRQNPEVGL